MTRHSQGSRAHATATACASQTPAEHTKHAALSRTHIRAPHLPTGARREERRPERAFRTRSRSRSPVTDHPAPPAAAAARRRFRRPLRHHCRSWPTTMATRTTTTMTRRAACCRVNPGFTGALANAKDYCRHVRHDRGRCGGAAAAGRQQPHACGACRPGDGPHGRGGRGRVRRRCGLWQPRGLRGAASIRL